MGYSDHRIREASPDRGLPGHVVLKPIHAVRRAAATALDVRRLPAVDGTHSGSGTAAVALGAFVAFGVVALILLSLASGEGRTSLPTTTQSTATATITIRNVQWDAAPHSFVPRPDELTVALRVRYAATEGKLVTYSKSDWVAQDADGVIYRTAVWPDRKPLGSGVIEVDGRGQRKLGWVAFMVPQDTQRLDVTFRQGDDEPLYWTIDTDGARKAVPTPTRVLTN
jgi:hypothetical protein